jgi:hypothetical protein
VSATAPVPSSPNEFLLTDDLSVVTVSSDGAGMALEWTQYYNSNELVAAIQSFNEGLTDMAEQLVARFGGRVMAQWAHNPNEATHA